MRFMRLLQLFSSRNALLLCCIGLGLLPFLLLCQYNQPFLDDFSFSADVQTHGMWGAQWHFYQQWSGRYFTNFLLFVANPLSYRWLQGVGLVAATSQLLRVAVLWLMVRSLTKQSLRKAETGLLAAGLALLYAAVVPSGFSALYYFTDIMVYQVPAWLLALVPLAVERAHRAAATKGRLAWGTAAALGTIAAAGSNELTLLLLGLVLAIGAGLSAQRRQWSSFRVWMGLGLLLLIFGLVSVLAPGNAVRRQLDAGLVPAPSAYEFLRRLLLLLRALFTEPAMLIIPFLTLVLSPLAARTLPARPAGLRIPLLLGAAVLVTGVVVGTMPYALMWARLPLLPRAANVLVWWWLLGWVAVAWASLPPAPALVPVVSPAIRALLHIALCIMLLASVTRACLDLRHEAPEFARQWQQRFAQLRHARRTPHQTLRLAPLPPLQNRQLLLPPDDVSPLSSYGVNTRLATWFGLDSVRVAGPR